MKFKNHILINNTKLPDPCAKTFKKGQKSTLKTISTIAKLLRNIAHNIWPQIINSVRKLGNRVSLRPTWCYNTKLQRGYHCLGQDKFVSAFSVLFWQNILKMILLGTK